MNGLIILCTSCKDLGQSSWHMQCLLEQRALNIGMIDHFELTEEPSIVPQGPEPPHSSVRKLCNHLVGILYPFPKSDKTNKPLDKRLHVAVCEADRGQYKPQRKSLKKLANKPAQVHTSYIRYYHPEGLIKLEPTTVLTPNKPGKTNQHIRTAEPPRRKLSNFHWHLSQWNSFHVMSTLVVLFSNST